MYDERLKSELIRETGLGLTINHRVEESFNVRGESELSNFEVAQDLKESSIME